MHGTNFCLELPKSSDYMNYDYLEYTIMYSMIYTIYKYVICI
jgi:hypothetical protein